jgi:hypothetical protein
MSISNARGKARCQPGSALIAATLIAAFTAAAHATTGTHYGLIISNKGTKNVSFSNGVFAATGTNANLNVSDLTNALASGNVEVTTGNGSGGEPNGGDLHINAGFTWTSKHALTLDAYRSIFVSSAVVDAGKGALTITDNHGGTGGDFNYAAKGSISIWNLADVLTINGQHYLLDGSIHSLAGDIEAKPAGYFALAGNYDASKDGTYTGAPIATEFSGTFEGLGNTISNLTVVSGAGLFNEVTGTLRDMHLVNVAVTGSPTDGVPTGALVGWETGLVDGATSSGSVTNNNAANQYPVGGLVGDGNTVANSSSTATVQSNYGEWIGGLVGAVGTVSNSSATGSVTAAAATPQLQAGGLAGSASVIVDSYAAGNVKVTGSGSEINVGGLVGLSNGSVTGSFATGAVTAPDGVPAGGLVGTANIGAITNSYATGNVAGGRKANVGGLIGEWSQNETGNVATSYSTGAPSAGAKSWIGGLLGLDKTKAGCGCFSDSYWDTTTSGIANPGQGAGFPPNEPGITGQTTVQLQAGLPAGFDPAIWAESPSINNGLPYLVANPPPQ